MELDSGRKLLVSLPIPEFEYTANKITYGDLKYPHPRYRHMGELIEQWVLSLHSERSFAHLDPDLDPAMFPRSKGWRGIFGQTGGAQQHLCNQAVGVGSLFLFYTAFRDAEFFNGRLRPLPRSSMQHVIWGWLYVGKKHELQGSTQLPEWVAYHPHMTQRQQRNNTIYEAADAFEELPGFGVFRRYREELCLTARAGSATYGNSRAGWRLRTAEHSG